MQERIVNPTTGIYRATPDYVHALEVSGAGRLLFVSGTMGLAEDGAPPAGLEAQLTLIWRNLSRILTAADMTMENVMRVTSYLTRAEFAEANQEARLHALGERRVPTTAIVAQTLDPAWLVEVEIIAAA